MVIPKYRVDNLTQLTLYFISFSCENIVLWRGHFKATGFEKSVNLSVSGGEGSRLSIQFQFVCDLISIPFA